MIYPNFNNAFLNFDAIRTSFGDETGKSKNTIIRINRTLSDILVLSN